jgi:hypothetical protein
MPARPILAIAVLLVAACTTGSPGSPAQSADTLQPSPPPATTAIATDAPAASLESAAVVGETPPAAALAAEGGDPVTAQLGSYTWAGTGSDAGWLPGAPMDVGHGEPVTVSLDPPTPIDHWAAIVVPSTATDPSGATSLGEGSGTPTFQAPAAGSWTVEVECTFADGVGRASYFWRLDVSA